MSETYQKAFEDMLMFGTGIIEVQEDGIKHIPFIDTGIDMSELELAKVKKIEGRKGKIVAMNELNPLNRKQRRIQASKDRRNGKNKV